MKARAKPFGWDIKEGDPGWDGAPSLEGLPEFVEGELVQHKVRSALGGFTYTKYSIDGVDIDPKTIEQVA